MKNPGHSLEFSADIVMHKTANHHNTKPLKYSHTKTDKLQLLPLNFWSCRLGKRGKTFSFFLLFFYSILLSIEISLSPVGILKLPSRGKQEGGFFSSSFSFIYFYNIFFIQYSIMSGNIPESCWYFKEVQKELWVQPLFWAVNPRKKQCCTTSPLILTLCTHYSNSISAPGIVHAVLSTSSSSLLHSHHSMHKLTLWKHLFSFANMRPVALPDIQHAHNTTDTQL